MSSGGTCRFEEEEATLRAKAAERSGRGRRAAVAAQAAYDRRR